MHQQKILWVQVIPISNFLTSLIINILRTRTRPQAKTKPDFASCIAIALFLLLLPSAQAQLFTPQQITTPTTNAMDIQAADLDGDGDLDLAVANEWQGNRVFYNDGTGNFTASTALQLPQIIHDSEDVLIADFDNDGDPDLIFVSEDDSVHECYLNNGTGTFSFHQSGLPNTIANAGLVHDFNGDSIPDLMLGNAGQNRILINNGNATFRDETSSRLPQHNDVTQDLQIADLTGDSIPDIIVGNEDKNRLLVGQPGGTYIDETSTRLPIFSDPETRKVSIADVDKDGDLDLFLCNVTFLLGKPNPDLLYINDGTGKFFDETQNRLPRVSLQTLDAVFLDWDNDGDKDLAITVLSPGKPLTYENDGQGNFSITTSVLPNPPPTFNGLALITADLNGDSLPDLYYANRGDTNWFITQNTPTNTTSPQPTPNTETTKPALETWPNPTDDHLNLRNNTNKPQTFRLYSPRGQQILTQEIPPNTVRKLRTDKLPIGHYHWQAEAENGTLIKIER